MVKMEGVPKGKPRNNRLPKRDILKMSFPKSRVEHSVTSYRYSKIYTSSYKNCPNEDECPHKSYLDKVLALRDLSAVEKRLVAKRAEAAEKVKILDKRWADLHEGQRALRENFKKFDEFLTGNQEKRLRAKRKIQEEMALQEERRDMLLKLENRMDYNRRIQAMMIEKIREYRIYEDFLTSVVKLSSDFKNVPAVLIRYHALEEAKQSAASEHEREVVALQKARGELTKLVEDKFTVLLGLRSLVGGLNSRYEAARAHALTWETTLLDVRHHAQRRYALSKGVLHAAKQLYRFMCERKATAPVARDLEERMAFIKHTLAQMHWISNVKFGGVQDNREDQYRIMQMGKDAAERRHRAWEEGGHEGPEGKQHSHSNLTKDKSSMAIYSHLLFGWRKKMSQRSGAEPGKFARRATAWRVPGSRPR